MTIEDYILWWEITDTLSVDSYRLDEYGKVVEVTINNGYTTEVLP